MILLIQFSAAPKKFPVQAASFVYKIPKASEEKDNWTSKFEST